MTAVKHLQLEGDIEGAAVILGHVEASEPSAISFAQVAGMITLSALPDQPEVESWKATGAAMNRHDLVGYALHRLGSRAVP